MNLLPLLIALHLRLLLVSHSLLQPTHALSDFSYLSSLVSGTRDDIHIVVTTGCSGYQNWQSETLLYSWAKLQQPGRFTRIIAGCKTERERLRANTTAIQHRHQYKNKQGINVSIDRINFYFVQDYTPNQTLEGVVPGHRPFWYFNKPYGFNEWLQHSHRTSLYESVIVLIDPDMILLRPFLFHLKEEADKVALELSATTTEKTSNSKPRLRDLYVREGHPVSQKYGIGAKWVKWSGFCDEIPSCTAPELTDDVAWRQYSVGPPYMMHRSDWLKVAPKWIEFSPLALKWEPQPSILAEMYSFVIACAYFDLRHEYLFSMISGPDTSVWMENWYDLNWQWVHTNPSRIYDYEHDDVKDGLKGGSKDGLQTNALTKKKKKKSGNPFKFHVLHYCHGYWLGLTRNHGTIRNGGWNWHKGHVPVDYLYDCSIPLLVEMTDYKENEMHVFIERDPRTEDHRHVWMLHYILMFVNNAVLNYRMTYCGRDYVPVYGLVLQQPEADVKGRRMNYVINEYQNTSLSWRGA